MAEIIAWDMLQPSRSAVLSQLAAELPAAVSLEAQTGRVVIDEPALRATLSRIPDLPDLGAAVREMIDFYDLGVLQYQVPDTDTPVPVPWGSIQGFLNSDFPAPRFLVQALNLDRIRSEAGVIRRLEETFVSVPPIMTQPAAAERLLMIRRRDDEGGGTWDPSDRPRPPSRPAGPPPPPPALPDITACLSAPRSLWSVDALGVLLCLDSPCTQTFADEIMRYTLAGGIGDFAKMAGGLVMEALKYGANASMAGFVVAVAITVAAGALRINILVENQASNGQGVCIRFFWPWIPFVGGLAHAKAR